MISFSAHLSGQVFNFVFQQNFNDNTAGDYLFNEWDADWKDPGWANHVDGYGKITQEGSNKYLTVPYYAGDFGIGTGGIQWPTDIGSYDELYFSYRIKFSEGFLNQDLHTKLPGLGGGELNCGGNLPDGTDGWTARYMMKQGTIFFYLYFPEMYLAYGDTAPVAGTTYYGYGINFIAAPMKANTWYTVTQRIVMNTPGYHNGIVEGYLNGLLVAQKTGLRFRDVKTLSIDQIFVSMFLGGSGVAPTTNESVSLDNVCAFLYADGVNVPRGNVASPAGRKLVLPYTGPSGPTNLKAAEISKASAKLSWTDNSINETGFMLIRSTSSDFSSPVTYTLTANTNAYTDTKLKDNTVYYYRVAAYNDAGLSGYSNVLKIQTLSLTPPSPPSNLVSTSVTKSAVTLGWTDNAGNEAGTVVERSPSPSSGFAAVDTVPANVALYTDNGLSLGTIYYYRIRAFNGDGVSAYSNVLEVRTVDILPPPSPTDLVCTSVHKHAVTLNWTDNAANESGTYVEKYNSSDGFGIIDTLPANTTTFSNYGLEGGTKYFYRVRAFNNDGPSNYSNVVEIQTLSLNIPDPPYNLNAKQLTKTSALISWNEDNTNEEGFELYRSDTSETFVLIANLDSNTLGYTDSGMKPAWSYRYKIRAFNSDGFSAYSDIIEVVTPPLYPPAAPTQFRTQKITYDNVVFTWRDNSKNELGFVIERTNPDASVQEFALLPDVTVYSDPGLKDSSRYLYALRAFNEDGVSYAAEIIQVYTPKLFAPQAPSAFRAFDYSAGSLTINWQDNSDNETAFVITRYPAADPDNIAEFSLPADDTSFTDINLTPNTSYEYGIYAVNKAGHSAEVNSIFATLSVAENGRIKDSLIAYYNFTRNQENIILDLSNYGEPLNLKVIDPDFISWDEDHKLTLVGNTLVQSFVPAGKIVEACKSTNAFSVELWVKPLDSYNLMESYLLSIDENESERAFFIAQWFSNLKNTWDYSYEIGLQTESTAASGLPYLDLSAFFSYINLNHIVYCIDETGQEKVYINGTKYAEGYRPGGFASWQDSYFLRLGNSEDLTHPWYGTYYLLAIYNAALSEEAIQTNYMAGPMDDMEMNTLNYTISIFPNPSSEIVNIELIPIKECDINEETTLKIIDLSGVTRFEEVVFNPSRYYLKTLTVKGLSKGIYVVQVSNGYSQKSSTFIVN